MGEGSDPVSRLLAFANAEFGDRLSELLLSGYGGGAAARQRSYAVLTRDGSGQAQEHMIKVATDHPSGLPSGREPLVLIALLKLLFAGTGLQTGRVVYAHKAVSEMIGWERSPETGEAVDAAVTRYFHLFYGKEESMSIDSGGTLMKHSQSRRLITGYDHQDEVEPSAGRGVRSYNRVTFRREFIEQLRGRSLFDFDWGHVISVRPLKEE
jgi:hypothetical protein